jgi:hypothetical protein
MFNTGRIKRPTLDDGRLCKNALLPPVRRKARQVRVFPRELGKENLWLVANQGRLVRAASETTCLWAIAASVLTRASRSCTSFVPLRPDECPASLPSEVERDTSREWRWPAIHTRSESEAESCRTIGASEAYAAILSAALRTNKGDECNTYYRLINERFLVNIEEALESILDRVADGRYMFCLRVGFKDGWKNKGEGRRGEEKATEADGCREVDWRKSVSIDFTSCQKGKTTDSEGIGRQGQCHPSGRG